MASLPRAWFDELKALDVAVYAAIAASPTPTLDRSVQRLSRAADHSKLWIATAGLMAALGGPAGRRAAASGLTSVAVTSGVVNAVVKPLGARLRPDRTAHRVPATRYVDMPESTSFPSGHAASAFAFASGVGPDAPLLSTVLSVAATVVAYARVHTGVHYPGDVLAGSLLGGCLGSVTAAARRHRTPAPIDRRSRMG